MRELYPRCIPEAVRRTGLFAVFAVTLLVPMKGQTVGNPPVVGAPGGSGATGSPIAGILQGGSLVGPGDLPTVFGSVLQVMGGRLTTAANAQITLTGTTIDSAGTRQGTVTIQAPYQFSYREGSGKAITFNGTAVQSSAGSVTAADAPIVESLLALMPDGVMLQAANGGGVRRIATHARIDDGKTANYMGPYLTVLEFAPTKRNGLAWGSAFQQELFVAVDEKTGLVSEVRRSVKSGEAPVRVTQTQFQNWFQQGTQWYPGKIVRLEGGIQTLSFEIETANTGTASALQAFVP